jgi:hypothetical protein
VGRERLSFPFRAWWVPDRVCRVMWQVSRGVTLPERVPVWTCGRGGGMGSWLVVGPRLRLSVVTGRSVFVPVLVGDGPRSLVRWSCLWSRWCSESSSSVESFVGQVVRGFQGEGGAWWSLVYGR